MRKKIIFLVSIMLFCWFLFSGDVIAQSPATPFQCCQEANPSQCWWYSSEICDDLEDPPGRPLFINQCLTGYCNSQACRLIKRNTQQSISYLGIFKSCLNLNDFLNFILRWAVVIAGLSALIKMGLGFLQYIWATGDPTKLEEARVTILYAIFGLLLVAITYAVLRLGYIFFPQTWNVWFGVR